jgi:hypothetical protein
MGKLTKDERAWLERLAETGTWPDRPFLRDRETANSLMRRGLAELHAPPPPYLRFAAITPAGRAALSEDGPDA